MPTAPRGPASPPPPASATPASSASHTTTLRHPVLVAGIGLVALQLVHRAWALLAGFFYADDFTLLSQARTHGLDASYLLEPFNSHVMPGSRLLIWLVESSGHLDWHLAATISLVLQAVASLACLWMLLTLFGERWWMLAPLTIYLTSAITAQATLWWISSLNQISIQATFFVAVGAWVQYLRTRRLRWLAATALAVAVGLLFFQKSLLVLPVLLFLALVYFATGSPRRRIGHLLRRYWAAGVVLGAVVAAYGVYSVTQVAQPFTRGNDFSLLALIGHMVATALAGAVGGPWGWEMKPGGAWADPPAPLLAAAVVAALAVASYAVLTRRRAFWAWVLLAGFLGVQVALIATSRAPVFGADIGRAFRLQTDTVCVLVLSLALAFAPLRGARQSSEPRTTVRGPALLARPLPVVPAAVVVALVAASGVECWSSYADLWHRDSTGAAFFAAADTGLRGRGTLDLADQVVPTHVVPGFSTPYNTTRRLLPLVSDDVRFPRSTDDLVVLDRAGNPWRATIDATAASLPGPDGECGWKVQGAGRTVPLGNPSRDGASWVRIGYLGSGQDTVEVRMGTTTTTVDVQRGLHNLFVRASGPVPSVTVFDLDPATTLCIDRIKVGRAVPGAPL